MVRRQTTAVTAISKISSKKVLRHAALVLIHGEELGRKYDLASESFSVGRSSKNDLQVDQDSVSRVHAIFSLQKGKVVVGDAGSTNGTYVNDERIQGDHRLKNGDLVKIGRNIFKFIASNNIEAAYHDEIYKLTTVDGLTQVYNRRFFEEGIEREISRCRRYQRSLSLVMLDIDHFKRVNDGYGHLAGDVVLKLVASTVLKKIRREDILARYGGEEFGVVLPEIDLKGALSFAEKVRRLIEKTHFQFGEFTIDVTMSAGVATLEKQESAEQLILRADEHLYDAKKLGRNRVAP
jgi:two-component system, cell cycle response regulator